MSLDETVRAAAAAVLARGGELGTTALAKAALVEMDVEEDAEAVKSACKALQRWKADGGPGRAGDKLDKMKRPLTVWSAAFGGAAPAAVKPRAGTVAAVMSGADPAAFAKIADALLLVAEAYAFSVGYARGEAPAAEPVAAAAETEAEEWVDPSEWPVDKLEELEREYVAEWQAERGNRALEYPLSIRVGTLRELIRALRNPHDVHPDDMPEFRQAFIRADSKVIAAKVAETQRLRALEALA